MILFEILIFALVLSFLVIIHELGHYVSARFFKVKVEEFGLGYPPRALKLFHHKGALFSLNWIPFGGFVKMEGEDGAESGDKKSEKNSSEEGPFYSKSAFARLVIILSGATINFLFGVLAFSIFFSWQGIPKLTDRVRIGDVIPNSPAAESKLPTSVEILGVQVGSEFLVINSIESATKTIAEYQGKTIKLVTTGQCKETTCDKATQEFAVYVRKSDEIPAGQGPIGIRFMPVVEQVFYPWYERPFRGAWYGVQQAFFLSKLILESLGQAASTAANGKVPSEVGSPIRIFREGRDAGIFSGGAAVLLNFAGIISINLAIFNVLPIPALDGGRAVMIILEKIIGKKRVAVFENYVNYAGLIFLLSLMVLVFAKDIRELF